MDELTIDELLKLPIKYLNGYLNGLDTYELLYDTRFIKLISTIKDVECYRSIMNKLTKYIDTSIIEKLRLIDETILPSLLLHISFMLCGP